MESIHLRIRIDGPTAEKALEMARARGMELPAIVRMMLTKAVQIGDFSIEKELAEHRQQEERLQRPPYFEYDEGHWNSMKTMLDAELALALVNQFMASHTLEIETLLDQEPLDAERIERLSEERERARRVLATLDPMDAESVQRVLAEYGPATQWPEEGDDPRSTPGDPS